MSSSATVAVGSSPCICDHNSTLNGPLPSHTWLIDRPSTDVAHRLRPDQSTARLLQSLKRGDHVRVTHQRRRRKPQVFGVPDAAKPQGQRHHLRADRGRQNRADDSDDAIRDDAASAHLRSRGNKSAESTRHSSRCLTLRGAFSPASSPVLRSRLCLHIPRRPTSWTRQSARIARRRPAPRRCTRARSARLPGGVTSNVKFFPPYPIYLTARPRRARHRRGRPRVHGLLPGLRPADHRPRPPAGLDAVRAEIERAGTLIFGGPGRSGAAPRGAARALVAVGRDGALHQLGHRGDAARVAAGARRHRAHRGS